VDGKFRDRIDDEDDSPAPTPHIKVDDVN
jgi:hypothetical protein